MTEIIIPITPVVDGQEYVIPVSIRNIPSDLVDPGTGRLGITSAEIILQTEKTLIEILNFETKVGMFEGKMFFFNNSPIVHNWQDNTINKQWRSPYNRGCAIGVVATENPMTEEDILFTVRVRAVDTGNAVINCSYLLLNTTIMFGKKPQMIDLSA